jgi:hypothetical protein
MLENFMDISMSCPCWRGRSYSGPYSCGIQSIGTGLQQSLAAAWIDGKCHCIDRVKNMTGYFPANILEVCKQLGWIQSVPHPLPQENTKLP